MIARVTIKGFKSILDETIDLGNLNVFVGANGAGKSALLEAIGVLGAAADGLVDDTSLLRRGVRPGVPQLYKSAFADEDVPRVIRLSAVSTEEPVALYTVSLDNPIGPAAPWRFNAEQVAAGGRKIVTRSPRGANFWRSGRTKRKFRPPDSSRSVARALSPFGPPPASVNALLDTLRDFAIFDPQTPILRGTEIDLLQRDPVGIHGGRLAEALGTLLKSRTLGDLQRDELEEMLDWAKRIESAPPTPDLISPSIPVATEIVRFTDRYMQDGRNRLSGYDASEGALYVLFALTLLFHPRSPRLFAIENIDHALHPRLARRLVATLAHFAPSSKRQILLTTHNPLVLDALNLAERNIRLFTVDRTEGGHTRARRVEFNDALAKAQQSGSTLSQMWTQGLLGAVPNLA